VDPRTIGWIGGITGAALGTLGGVAGTYFSIKNTNGPRERAFMVRVSAACWVAVTAFLVTLGLTPFPYRAWLWLPYMVLLPWAIRAGNRRQEQIRREEARDVSAGAAGGV
jgi:hypothetical protein